LRGLVVLLAADVEARGAEASELGERGAYITPHWQHIAQKQRSCDHA
jgi:hypothetical protein